MSTPRHGIKPGDRVLVKPLGVYGTVIRLKGEHELVIMADSAQQEVVWFDTEVEKI